MTPDQPTLDWLARLNLYSPQRVAFVEPLKEVQWTYAELFTRAKKMAGELSSRHRIGKGDRVAIMAANRVETVILFFALQRLSAILVPINFRFTLGEVAHVINDSGAKLFLHESSFEPMADNLRSTALECKKFDEFLQQTTDCKSYDTFTGEWDHPVMILYTSGTTGFPKGAIITHKMLFWNSMNTGLRLNLTESDVTLSFLPLFHTGGWNVLMTPFLHRGGKLIFMDKFNPDQVLQHCQDFQVTILFGVPTTMDMLTRSELFHQVNLKSVRYAIVGGEPMPMELIKTWQLRGIPIRQGYGLTEFGPNVFSLNEEDALRKIGSIGFPNFYIDARVVNEDGGDCADNEIGELWLKGPMCMAGYWGQQQATDEVLSNGWLRTGDLVRRDNEGYYYVVGRKKEMFISGGENVYPAEVERVIRDFQGVHEVAVVGVKDDKWGEVGHAHLSLDPGFVFEKQAVIDHCRRHLARFKVPAHFSVHSELPKSDSGKILKRKLTEAHP